LYALILRLVIQSCTDHRCDSWAISAYEDAIIEPEGAGFVENDHELGRIGAKLLPKAYKFLEWIEFHDRRDRIRKARHELATVPGVTPKMLASYYNITVDEIMAPGV
jgi:hypothetical protein